MKLSISFQSESLDSQRRIMKNFFKIIALFASLIFGIIACDNTPKTTSLSTILSTLTATIDMVGLTDKASNVATAPNSNFVAPGWNLLGEILDINPTEFASHSFIAIDLKGNPIVAWNESNGTSFNLYVKKLVGNTWTLVGKTVLNVNTDEDSLFIPSIAIDSSGNPIVAWSEYDDISSNIHVKKLVSNTWTLVGKTVLDAKTNHGAYRPSIAIDSSGNPIVAWYESDGTSHNIYVKKLVGNTWTLVGKTFLDAKTNRDAFSPSIAIDSKGNPIVAWHETDGTSSNIYVKKLVGNTWTLVGTTFLDAKTDYMAFSPSIAIDSKGNPIVAWYEFDGSSNNIYVKKLVDNTWTLVGTTFLDAKTNQGAFSPSIAIDSRGNPIVAWDETDDNSSNIYVKKFNRIP